MKKDLSKIINFLHQAEKLKSELRHSWQSSGRRESVAEHTWRMCLLIMCLNGYLGKKINLEKALKLAVVHDLGEVYAGDYFAWKGEKKDKEVLERKAMQKIVKVLPPKLRNEILKLWEEAEAKKTYESKFVAAVDKVECMLQHNEAKMFFQNKIEIPLNLIYGTKEAAFNKAMLIFRALVDDEMLKKYKREKVNKKLYEQQLKTRTWKTNI